MKACHLNEPNVPQKCLFPTFLIMTELRILITFLKTFWSSCKPTSSFVFRMSIGENYSNVYWSFFKTICSEKSFSFSSFFSDRKRNGESCKSASHAKTLIFVWRVSLIKWQKIWEAKKIKLFRTNLFCFCFCFTSRVPVFDFIAWNKNILTSFPIIYKLYLFFVSNNLIFKIIVNKFKSNFYVNI